MAKSLIDDNTNVIHLDPYFEKMDKNITASIRDEEFDSFLIINFPEFDSITNPTKEERYSKQWWNNVDTLMDQTEKFSELQFCKNKRVVVEGVQLNDETTYRRCQMNAGRKCARNSNQIERSVTNEQFND